MWKILRSAYVVDTPFLRLRKDDIELPGGRLIENYYVRETLGYVVIYAVTPDDRVVLVRQYKHGIGSDVLELPAGAIEPGEDPQETARRELAEETGYVAEPPLPSHVRTFISDPTNSNGRFHLYYAPNATQQQNQDLDPTEDIAVELVPRAQLLELARNGTIEVATHVMIAYLMDDHLRRGVLG